MSIKNQFTETELETILRITQIMLDETRGFRIPERKSGLSVSELVDIKRKIERVLGIPTRPLVDYTKSLQEQSLPVPLKNTGQLD